MGKEFNCFIIKEYSEKIKCQKSAIKGIWNSFNIKSMILNGSTYKIAQN